MAPNVAGEERFEDEGTWREAESEIPVLEDSLVSFVCRVTEQIPSGSHTVYLCDVIEIHCAPDEEPPLMYFGGEFSRLSTGS
jgi:flavin reductase (DIM6/NTAB) family NADH-FMN oxidoreductase RutF